MWVWGLNTAIPTKTWIPWGSLLSLMKLKTTSITLYTNNPSFLVQFLLNTYSFFCYMHAKISNSVADTYLPPQQFKLHHYQQNPDVLEHSHFFHNRYPWALRSLPEPPLRFSHPISSSDGSTESTIAQSKHYIWWSTLIYFSLTTWSISARICARLIRYLL